MSDSVDVSPDVGHISYADVVAEETCDSFNEAVPLSNLVGVSVLGICHTVSALHRQGTRTTCVPYCRLGSSVVSSSAASVSLGVVSLSHFVVEWSLVL